MFLTYEPKENTKSSSHIPRRAGIERADATPNAKCEYGRNSLRRNDSRNTHTGTQVRV